MSRRHFIAGFFLCLTPFPLIVREHSRCLAAAEADAPAAIETLEQVGAILTRDGEGLVVEVRFPVSGASADKNNAAIAALAGLARVRSVVLAGSGVLTIEGEDFALDSETMARVGPSTKRKVVAGPDGIRMLVLGGVPGEAYEPPEWGELGIPDPMAG